jgi:hypothetical protein
MMQVQEQDQIKVINTIRVASTVFLVIGFLSVMGGLIVSINNNALVYDFYAHTTVALRNAAEANSTVTQVMAAIESNKVIANALYASGIGALLFGIGLAIVDVLRLQSPTFRR